MRPESPTTPSGVSPCLRRSALERLVRRRGSSTFWKAVRTGIRLYIWKTKPTWRARQAVSLPADRRVISSPATVMLPEVGRSSPPIRLRRVVLPEPLGPMKATNSPLSTSRFKPWRTWISSLPRWYFLSRLRTRTRLAPFPFPSTLTMLLSSSLHLHSLPIVQHLGAFHHELDTRRQARRDLDIGASGRPQAHRKPFPLNTTQKKYTGL